MQLPRPHFPGELNRCLVPGKGFEPPTFALQGRCTTAVLPRRYSLYRPGVFRPVKLSVSNGSPPLVTGRRTPHSHTRSSVPVRAYLSGLPQDFTPARSEVQLAPLRHGHYPSRAAGIWPLWPEPNRRCRF